MIGRRRMFSVFFTAGYRIPLAPFCQRGNSTRCNLYIGLQTFFVKAPLSKGVRSGGFLNPPTHSIKGTILALLEVFGLGKRNFWIIDFLDHVLEPCIKG